LKRKQNNKETNKRNCSVGSLTEFSWEFSLFCEQKDWKLHIESKHYITF